MFMLHESLRRALCRLGFVAFCLAPTVGLLAWCAARHSPLYVDGCQRRLAELTALRVALAGAAQPRPNWNIYRAAELYDPETDSLLLRCERIETYANGAACVVSLSAPETTQAALPRLGEAIERQLRRPQVAADQEVRLTACKLNLHTDGAETGKPRIEVIEGGLTMGRLGRSGELRFRWLNGEASEIATLRLERRADGPRPSTYVELDTGGGELPCSLLASWCDVAGVLGPGSTFRGMVWIEVGEKHCSAEIAGQFRGLDLDALVTRRFPHVLTGHATLELEQARFEQGKLVEAVGRLEAGPGTIGPTLVNAAVGALSSHGNLLRPPWEIEPYKQLAVRFELSRDKLLLRGDCGSGRRGALVVDNDDRTLIAEPRSNRLSGLALVRLLAPDSGLQVPATRETAALLDFLPLPAARSEESRQQ